MKKGLSPVFIFMIALLVVLVAYFFLYLTPAQAEMISMEAEINIYKAEAAIYQEYIGNTKSLEADIAAIRDEISAMHAEDYTNESQLSLVLSDAIQANKLSLNSVSLGKVTTRGENRALPVTVSVNGTTEDILSFIRYFETNTEGSYLVQASSLDITGKVTKATLVIYLCTPDM